MKKAPILISIISLFCLGMASLIITGVADGNLLKRSVASGDYYSITINAEDVTTNESLISDTFIAHTDQQNNPITFNYENLRFEQDGENKYLVFGEDSFFGNDKNSQIRKLEQVAVYGDNGAFTYDFGWSTKSGSIVYTGDDYSGSANGVDISLGTNWPNYFTIMHRDGADARISKIVFKYLKDCIPGVQPTLDSISVSGQTTSINRGKAFSFGGTVTAHYANGTTANVTSLTTFSGYDMSTSGTYTVTASYTEKGITKTTTYSLTVNKVWTTLWSGTKDIYVSIKTDGGLDGKTNGMGTIVSKAVHSSKQLRVSFSGTYLTDVSSWPTDVSSWVCGIYWGNASRATSFGSSPKSVTISSWGSTILNVRATSSETGAGSSYWAGFKIATDSSGNITASATHTPSNGRLKIGIKLTKIEEYY